jgi:hypothetical protein
MPEIAPVHGICLLPAGNLEYMALNSYAPQTSHQSLARTCGHRPCKLLFMQLGRKRALTYVDNHPPPTHAATARSAPHLATRT